MRVFYLALCEECGFDDEPMIMPFTDPDEREKWIDAHLEANDHLIRKTESR